MHLRTFLCATLCALLPTLAPADVSVPEADGNGTYAARWIGDASGQFHVIWRPVLDGNGRVLICGIWTVDNAILMPGVQRILSRALVQIDGRDVRRGLGGLARSPTQRSMETTPPTCVATEARGGWTQVAILFGGGSFSN